MSHIFISYSRKDSEYSNALVEKLRSEGFDVWFDRDIAPGAGWSDIIEEKIDTCAAFLLIMTANSKKSTPVKNEYLHAQAKNKPIFPLRLEGEIWLDFRSLNCVDLRSWNLPEDKFYNDLAQAAPRKRFSPAKPPQPEAFRLPMLEWIDIPAGEVKIEGKPYHVDAFQIAKYPVTVHQFEYFVNYNEYKIRENWTTAGLEWRNENGIALPEFWNNSEWHISTHPVVGVSWYEALAFCWWLREKIHLKVTLPTEEQWQRAAQGDDGRKFPWGMGFDNNRANTEESGIRKTTPVDKYSAGASPFGVMDMSGNVYEWCLNQWDDIESGSPSIVGNARRSVRGGNWSYPQAQAGTMDRESRSPIARKPGLGFRVCRSLT